MTSPYDSLSDRLASWYERNFADLDDEAVTAFLVVIHTINRTAKESAR